MGIDVVDPRKERVLRVEPCHRLERLGRCIARGPLITSLARDSIDKEQRDIWSFSPGLEVSGMRHAKLERRLFRS